VDGFNALVMRTELDWRQAGLLRAEYAGYARTVGSRSNDRSSRNHVGHPEMTAPGALVHAS